MILIFVLFLCAPMLAQAEDAAAGTRVSLTANAEAVLANDEVVITFRVEKQGQDAEVVRQYVNRVSSAIAQRLKQEKDVRLSTISRSMQPVWQYPKNSPRIRTGWQMIQSGQAVSMRLDAVPHWLDAIESAGANLSGLSFRVSAAVLEQAMVSLRQQAVCNFRSSAASMAKGLDAASFRIVHLNTGSRQPQPRVFGSEMAMMARSADAAPPALSAGENRISVTVSGDIELPFTDFPAQ